MNPARHHIYYTTRIPRILVDSGIKSCRPRGSNQTANMELGVPKPLWYGCWALISYWQSKRTLWGISTINHSASDQQVTGCLPGSSDAHFGRPQDLRLPSVWGGNGSELTFDRPGNMFVYTYMYIRAYVHVYVYVYIYTHLCICIHTRMCVYTSTHMYMLNVCVSA